MGSVSFNSPSVQMSELPEAVPQTEEDSITDPLEEENELELEANDIEQEIEDEEKTDDDDNDGESDG